jgi:hypothetical protein
MPVNDATDAWKEVTSCCGLKLNSKFGNYRVGKKIESINRININFEFF